MLIKKIPFWLSFLLLLVLGLTVQAQGITIPSNTGLPDGSIAGVLTTTLNWLLMIFVIIATISFVITGLQFIFSFGGASGSEAQAKKNFAYTIIAIFVVGGSLIILKTVIGLLGPSTGGGNNNVITNGAGGYSDNDAIEGNNNAALQNDASHNADNPTQNDPTLPGQIQPLPTVHVPSVQEGTTPTYTNLPQGTNPETNPDQTIYVPSPGNNPNGVNPDITGTPTVTSGN